MGEPAETGRRFRGSQQRGAAPASAPAAGARTVLLVADGTVDIAGPTRALEGKGFAVRRVRDVEHGVVAALADPYDLVLVAVGERAGVSVCRRIRARAPVPVLIVSPAHEEPGRVAGLEAGADDCVSAPVTGREVAARVEAVLRRGRAPARRRLELQDVEILVAEREVVVAGRPVELTAREFDVLCYLAERAGEVVTRRRLLTDVWGLEDPGETRTVDVHIAQLRRKLGRPGAIRTVRGVGYKALPFPGQNGRTARREAAAG